MALMHVNFFSNVLGLSVQADVIIPQQTAGQIGMEGKAAETYPTLYLLHGMSDDQTIWQRRTSIERYAADLGIAVVMPTTHLGFYTDTQYGYRYWTYISKELPAICRSFFKGMSDKREDTFAAGLSMGGYGAITNGLKYSETFGRIAGLSSGLILDRLESAEPELTERVFGPDFKKTIFGDPIIGSDKDYHALAKRLADSGKPLPEIYLCCGTEDDLLEASRAYARELKDLGYPVSYEEGPGGHDWEF